MPTQDNQQGTGGQGTFPVDNQTYNLLQVIVSKLESIEAYGKYAKDGGPQGQNPFPDLLKQDTQDVHKLLPLLKSALQKY